MPDLRAAATDSHLEHEGEDADEEVAKPGMSVLTSPIPPTRAYSLYAGKTSIHERLPKIKSSCFLFGLGQRAELNFCILDQ